MRHRTAGKPVMKLSRGAEPDLTKIAWHTNG
ncbi:hypothetical protein FrEUN1fDRAFT_7521 [Parafrankia sp. EUN1f]|nr:hypothetical protein FrEUN1fDRAFT_7521 [Parafrankia sp. EUN1f]